MPAVRIRLLPIVAGFVGFSVLLVLREIAPDVVWRAIIAVAAGACLSMAFVLMVGGVEAPRGRAAIGRFLGIAAGVVGFALFTAVRDETPILWQRVVVGGAAGACMGISLVFAIRR